MSEPLPPPWWPHRATSEFIRVGASRWHVQRFVSAAVDAPVALLLHGTGASTHSWRHLAPLLASRFEVIAPDLPGHAFTATSVAQSRTLPAVAEAVAGLLQALSLRPALVVGHSAGAAVALRLALDRHVAASLLVSINGALMPMKGPVGRMFLPLARVLARNPLVAPTFAACARSPAVTRRLLDSTGSRIDAIGERCYAELVSSAVHAAGALRLMASWDLEGLAEELPALGTALLLMAADADRTVPASQAQTLAGEVHTSRLIHLPRLGHLAHEEDAGLVAHHVLQAWHAACAAASKSPSAASPCVPHAGGARRAA